MARFDTSGLQDLINDMRRMGETSGDVAQVMTAAAAEEVAKAWKRSAEEHELRDTGAMIESIGYPRGVEKIGDVCAVDIYPQGKDASGTRNAEKAFVLHYGTSRRPPTYWVDDADKYAAEPVQKRLEEIWGQFLETGQVPAVPLQSTEYKRSGTKKTKV